MRLSRLFSHGKEHSYENLGIISSTSSSLEKEKSRILKKIGAGRIVGFTLYGSDYSNSITDDRPNSFPFMAGSKQASGRFDAIYIGGSIRVFDTLWHQSMFQLIRNMAIPGGTLLLEGQRTGSETLFFGMPQRVLEIWLECEARPNTNGLFEFRLTPTSVHPSAFTWLAERGPGYIQRLSSQFEGIEEVDYRRLGLRELPNSFVHCEDRFPGVAGGQARPTAPVAQAVFRELEYLGIGAGNKFAAIKAVLDRYVDRSQPAKILDHGSALGLIPCEALFEPDLDVEKIVIVEALDDFRSMAYDFFTYLTDDQRRRIAYERSSAEDFQYSEQYDVIGLIHMFFLVEEGRRASVFRRAYDALEPGGAVILWEMPKTEASAQTHYYDRMMTWDQIEALCAPFGPTVYLDPKYLIEVDPNNHRDKQLIRVIRKAGAEIDALK